MRPATVNEVDNLSFLIYSLARYTAEEVANPCERTRAHRELARIDLRSLLRDLLVTTDIVARLDEDQPGIGDCGNR